MSLNKQKHIRYWRMCASVLPDAYQSSDAGRMSLGFFIVAALDLLDILSDQALDKPVISAEERQKWVEWIYGCQIPDGQGFRGFPGTDLADRRNNDNRQWDPGNLPNSFFAIATLLILGDDLARVHREQMLAWLPQLQRSDGSFGEFLGPQDAIEGGRDLRYCCCAAGIAYILQSSGNGEPYQQTFDEDRLIDYILDCQGPSGGFGESPLREPHSGVNYCAIATLELISRLGGPSSSRARQILSEQREPCVRWLLERQTTVFHEEEEPDGDSDGEAQDGTDAGGVASFANSPMYYSEPPLVVGFNGRENKIADTCYCFWNSGSLVILDSLYLANLQAVRRFLLEKVQHVIGGFAKDLDSPPDVMHSYLGLAVLSLYGEAGVESLDPALCISRRAAANLHRVVWRGARTSR